MEPQDVIVRRAAKEVRRKQKVAIGPGIPELIQGAVDPGTEVFRLDDLSTGKVPGLKIAVVEAAEVSEGGDLCLPPGSRFGEVQAEEWVAVTTHTDPSGNPRIVRKCHSKVFLPHCVKKIITEKGVIEVTDKGLVLKEVRPGVATDDVRKATAASLHIADDLKLMEL
jgi:acyl CoA:acetate/3-ketoacid CoA transferase beta subunit